MLCFRFTGKGDNNNNKKQTKEEEVLMQKNYLQLKKKITLRQIKTTEKNLTSLNGCIFQLSSTNTYTKITGRQKSFSLYIEDQIKLNIFDDNQLCFISE